MLHRESFLVAKGRIIYVCQNIYHGQLNKQRGKVCIFGERVKRFGVRVLGFGV